MVSQYVPPTGSPREIILNAFAELNKKFRYPGYGIPEVNARKAIKRALEDAGLKATSEAENTLWTALRINQTEHTEKVIAQIVGG
jgi:hypothetical protein